MIECESRRTVYLDQPTNVRERKFSGIPDIYSIAGTYPNPFNPVMTAVIGLPEPSLVSLRVYNLEGRLVDELEKGNLKAGYHSYQFNATGLASGLYFIHASVPGKFSEVQKILLVK